MNSRLVEPGGASYRLLGDYLTGRFVEGRPRHSCSLRCGSALVMANSRHITGEWRDTGQGVTQCPLLAPPASLTLVCRRHALWSRCTRAHAVAGQ